MATLKHKTAEQVLQKKRESLIQQAKSECTRRIESEWNKIGQVNAALGVYSEADQQACREHIAHHRGKLQNLIQQIEGADDLSALDATEDKHW